MKFSVILPVYNTISTLERAVRSVTEQSFSDLEVLLVDDGSTDGSGELCDRLAAADRRITVIHQENRYVGAARNAGVSRAAGEYLYFLDSDDRLSEGILAKVAPQTGADVIASSVRLLHGTRRTLSASCRSASDLFLFSPFLGQSFYARAWVQRTGVPFSEERKTAEDCEWLFAHLQAAESISWVQAPFYEYTEGRTGSLSTAYRESALSPTLATWRALYDRVAASRFDKKDKLRAYCADALIEHCIVASLAQGDFTAQIEACIPYFRTRGCKIAPLLWLRHIIGMQGLLWLCNRKMKKEKPVV